MGGQDLSDTREEYKLDELNDSGLPDDPLELFDTWYKMNQKASAGMGNAFILSTATPDGKPSARVVLLKSYSKLGYVFFTNFESRKGHELAANPNCSYLFYWPELQKQVRVEGKIAKVSEKESEEYFDSRPEGSKISAIISSQSTHIQSRKELEEKVAQFKGEVKRPSNWGGYSLTPNYYEFWQGRESRLHDRICFELGKEGQWNRYRLSP